MSDSTQDASTPDHETLFELVDSVGEELRAVLDGYQQHAANPRTWPNLAAVLQYAGAAMAEAGEQLAEQLAAHAQAHPQIEVPEDGPGVMLLPESEHRGYWNVVGELFDPAGYEETLRAYAEVLDGEHGRPDLEVRAVGLGDGEAVMVLQYLPEQGPDAICQVYIGGWDHERHHDEIQQALADHDITPGRPRFWPPIIPDTTFITMPGDAEMFFDAFGRRVDQADRITEILDGADLTDPA